MVESLLNYYIHVNGILSCQKLNHWYIGQDKIDAGEGRGLKPNSKFNLKVFNPLAVYVSRAVPGMMSRYTTEEYSSLVDIFVGGSPLRDVAISALQSAASKMKVKLPTGKMKDLIKNQGDIFRKKHMWTEAPDDEKKSPPPGGGETKPKN